MLHALRRALPVILIGVAGCSSSSPSAPHGSPVLLRVLWERSSGSSVVWSNDDAAHQTPTVAGDATRAHFVFDRRLDGERIEETVDGAPVSRQPPAISVTWPDSDTVMSAPPFAVDAFYNSAPPRSAPFGPGTSDVFIRPHAIGLPSATTVSFVLDKTALTSVYGEPVDAPDEIAVAIEPLVVLSAVGSSGARSTVPAGFMLPVSFNNRPADPAALTPFTHAWAGDVELPVAIAGASGSSTRIYVSPAACLGGWPSGPIDVRFDAGLPDAFGVPTPAPFLAGSFLVAAGTGSGTTADGGCPAP
jgi:hypothetical protein